MRKQLKERFNKNQKEIVRLLNENIDLQYEYELSKAESFENVERTVKGKTHQLKIMKWTEYFPVEETGEKIRLTRERIIEVDGERSSGWKKLEYYTFDDGK